jgi:ribosome-associated translation inhibitor RaiA
MQITVHASGFDLTAHTRSFAESRLLSTLGRFNAYLASITVRLDARTGGTRPATVCAILVLHPSGELRSTAEHAWAHVAIDRAATHIASEVERELLRRHAAVQSPALAGERRRDRVLEFVRADRLSQRPREQYDRPKSSRRPVGERWRPPLAEDSEGAR